MNEKQKKILSIIRHYLINKGKSPSIRDIQKEMKYQSPRSVALLLTGLMGDGYIKRKDSGELQLIQEDTSGTAQTVNVPVVGLVACGTPIFAEENIEAYIPVSTQIARPSNKYFFLRAQGD